MMQMIKMAFRNIARNKRRSFFSALALGMGLSLLLLMASVIEGEMRDAFDGTIRLQSGHFQVQAGSYNEDQLSVAWEDLVKDPDAVAAQIAQLKPVKAATPRLYASGIITVGENTAGVRVVGIDPASPANEPFQTGVIAGASLTADDREGLLIGRNLADKLGKGAGETVNLLVNTSDGAIDEQAFAIRGVYSTGFPGYDESTVFLPMAKAQAFTRTENHASTIFVLLDSNEQMDSVINALQAGKYKIRTYIDANELMIQTEELSNAYMAVLYLIVLGITATVIVNTLVMAVFERTREIGILAAIGMKTWRIMALFFIESVLLALGGIFIGLILGGLMALYAGTVGFYIGNMGITGIMMGERMYGYLTVSDTVTLAVIALIVTLLAAIYPAALAARLEPVDALRGK